MAEFQRFKPKKRGFNGRSDRGSSRRDSRSSGRRFDRDSESSDRRFSRDEKTRVVCDSCGKSCEVPFKPRTDKPLYCDDCFRKEGSSPNKPSVDLDKINEKLDKIITMLEED